MSWPFAEAAADRRRPREDGAEVGVLGRGDRRRDADEDRVGLGEVGLGRRDDTEAAVQGGYEALVGDVVDRGRAGVELRDAAGVRVDAFDLQPGLGERDGQRQADVAQADDGHAPVFAHDPSEMSRHDATHPAPTARGRATGRAVHGTMPPGRRAGARSAVLPFAPMSATHEAPASFRSSAVRPGPIAPVREGIQDSFSRRRLIRYLVQADLKKKGADTLLGNIWWMLDPLLQMVVYVILVSLIFQRKQPDYPLFVFAAILPWKWFSSSGRRRHDVGRRVRTG